MYHVDLIVIHTDFVRNEWMLQLTSYSQQLCIWLSITFLVFRLEILNSYSDWKQEYSNVQNDILEPNVVITMKPDNGGIIIYGRTNQIQEGTLRFRREIHSLEWRHRIFGIIVDAVWWWKP